MEKISYSYDEASDMFVIEGVYYSGQFFRDMGIIRPCHKFEISCNGPVIKMRHKECAIFSRVSGIGRASSSDNRKKTLTKNTMRKIAGYSVLYLLGVILFLGVKNITLLDTLSLGTLLPIAVALVADKWD